MAAQVRDTVELITIVCSPRLALLVSFGSIPIFLLCMAGCSRTTDVSRANKPAVSPASSPALTPARKAIPDKDLHKLTESNNEFAFALYSGLKNDKRQFVISPYSISANLAMVYAGARGATAEEIAKVCRFAASPEQLPEVYAALIGANRNSNPTTAAKNKTDSPANAGYIWHEANALWVQQGLPLRTEYRDLLSRCFAAEAHDVDFTDPAGLDAIDRWIARQTQNKIKDLKRSMDKDTLLSIVNCVYFKADWRDP